jgi:hypothetical protein
MATSNSSSSSSDANHYAAIDRITHDAENTPHQHQPIQNEIANAVANAELVDGVLGPAHHDDDPNYRQIISVYAQRICKRISGALQRVPDPVCKYIEGRSK